MTTEQQKEELLVSEKDERTKELLNHFDLFLQHEFACSYCDAIRRRIEDAGRLRKLLWLRHGCPVSALYGDDGEMQCNSCGLDFKRMSVTAIEQRWATKIEKLIRQHLAMRQKEHRDRRMG
jgi:DNA-binding GntR family transcriptional regulator